MQGAVFPHAGLAQRPRGRTRIASATLLWFGIVCLSGFAQGAVVVRRHVVAGGGATSSNGAITLRGTSGQCEADALDANGATTHLQGGYWAVASAPDDRIFANGFEP